MPTNYKNEHLLVVLAAVWCNRRVLAEERKVTVVAKGNEESKALRKVKVRQCRQERHGGQLTPRKKKRRGK